MYHKLGLFSQNYTDYMGKASKQLTINHHIQMFSLTIVLSNIYNYFIEKL